MPRLASLFALVMLLGVCSSARADELDVLGPADDGTPPGKQFEAWLKRRFEEQVQHRSTSFEIMLKSLSAAKTWQDERRAFFLRQIGELPERTPLDAQVVGVLPGKGYRIEKILLASRPNFHVTANLYLPDSPGPWPAVLVPCGHSHDGKAVGQYQRASILLARNGLAAMCYDPIGQGERYQMLDLTQRRAAFDDAAHVPTPHPHVRYMCTTEHTMIGVGADLLGGNVAQFRIWDGMRVIDYLQSRDDILADKIGCCGNSGGGTETAYLMALDDRIVAASPGCYLTTFQRLIETKGPQDGEQNIFGQIAFGMDQADYCLMRAPKPTLICAGTRDATFDFRGTWELFLDAKRFYSRLGHADKMDINAPDAPHGFTLQQREATVRFMRRWLLGSESFVPEVESLPDAMTDEELRAFNQPDWTAEQLQCTPQGQVLMLRDERSVFDIHAETAARLRQQRAERWKQLPDASKRERIAALIGPQSYGQSPTTGAAGAPSLLSMPLESRPAPQLEIAGILERDGYRIYKLKLAIGDNLHVGALAFVPQTPRGPATLYLHGTSMKADAGADGPILERVRQGHVVLAAELRGIGETETGHGHREFGKGRFGPDNLEIFTAYLLGRSYVGMRCQDVHQWLRVLQQGQATGKPPTAVHLVAIGEAAVPALHAAALAEGAFETIRLQGMIPSWEHVAAATETFNQTVNSVHGALQVYDLPDLVPLTGAAQVTIEAPLDALGQPYQEKPQTP